MIAYATIGTNDLERATKFYDAVLAPLGGRRTFANGDRMQFYGSKDTPGMIAVSKPYDEQPATAGNGTMFGLPAGTKADVDAAYAAAIAAGAVCDGAPGQRMPTFYGAYFRDPDGNKVCVFNMG
ncbi:MAG: VOC family protein [Alphaproteobacteria bacterium]|nr:VOC family protein [Alphaproteobacteria bacterium]MBU1515861.1 VOC family protein [Alphaproteobacteria bacterium]MBU2094083.1 VOC family protein [Alphaproteobacteria bacterium]MBU2151435.1 VOC family protein [Alphaproteobacteria bacterium]MBU2305289.1 VOC family protein [Alphaproteobacteria bacterium]